MTGCRRVTRHLSRQESCCSSAGRLHLGKVCCSQELLWLPTCFNLVRGITSPGRRRWQMADGCWLRRAPLSPRPAPPLQPLNPALSAQVFHELASLLTGSWGDVCLVSEHHPRQGGGRGALCSIPGGRGALQHPWRKKSPLQHPWRKRSPLQHPWDGGSLGALSSIPGTNNLCQSLQPSSMHTGSHGHLSSLPRLSLPSRKDEDVAESNLTFTQTGKPPSAKPEWKGGILVQKGLDAAVALCLSFPICRAWGNPASPQAL